MTKKVQWGIIGAGGIVERATGAALNHSERAHLRAIATRNPAKSDFLKEHYSPDIVYESYQALLDDPEIDAVYIAVPNALHDQWAIAALNAGKHVLCEKPLAIEEKRVVDMFAAADKNDRLLMEGFAFIHSPIVDKVRELIDEGAIGEVGFVDSHFYYMGHPETSPVVRRPTYGGSLYDLGCYNVVAAYLVYGKEPRHITGFGNFTYLNVDDFTSFLFEYDNGAKAHLISYLGSPGRSDGVRIFGTKGTLEIPLSFNFAGEGELILKDHEGGEKRIAVSAGDNYQLEFDNMNDAILDGTPLKVTRDFSIRQARTMDRMFRTMNY